MKQGAKIAIPILIIISLLLGACQNSQYSRKPISLSGIWAFALPETKDIGRNYLILSDKKLENIQHIRRT